MMLIKLSDGCIRSVYAHDVRLLGEGTLYLRNTKETLFESDVEEMYSVA